MRLSDSESNVSHSTIGAKDEEGSGGSLLRAARAGNVEKLVALLDNDNVDIKTANSSGLASLHLAAKEGHCDVIKELLNRNAPIDQPTKRGNTALHVASLAGKLQVVELLVDNGADTNSQAQNAFTPLYMAAQEGHEDIVEYLLKNGANQSISTQDGFTPLAVALQENKDQVVALLLDNDVKGRVKLPALHIAARKDDVKAAALLLQNDNNAETTAKMMVNRTTESGFTALHIAAHYGNVNVSTLLLNRGAVVDFRARSGITPMHVAAKRGHTRFCALMLERDGDPAACTRDGLVPLHCAARSGHLPVVKLFLDCEKTPKLSRTKNGLSALHMAVQGCHLEVVRLLLGEKYSVDDMTSDYLSALHIAAHCGHVEIAELLLSHGAHADCKALNGFTPLHVACKKDRLNIVLLLLEHGVEIEAVTESGLTPLHIACFMGNAKIVEALVRKEANLDCVNVRGETALHMATRAGREDIFALLLQRGADPDARKQESQTCLHLSARLGRLEILKLLLEHGANVNACTSDGYTPLHIATKENHADICHALIEHRADVALTTKKGFTALHLAAKYGRLEMASLLLRSGASPDVNGKDGLTPLHVAAHYDNQQVALLLLQNNASPHLAGKNGYTPLHIAAKKNQMDIALSLLEFRADANCATRMHVTPLLLAAQAGHTDMCSVLLARDANVNATAKHGLTAMHLAAQDDRVAVAKVLFDNQSLVDPLTKTGCTPLHVASHHGNLKVASFLLSLGAKVNAKTKNGYTPLHQAAQQGHTHVVNLLLQNGASPDQLTNSGNTALSLADRLGYVTVVDTLKTVTTETTTTVTEEKRKMNVPETLGEGFMSDASDDEGEGSVLGGQYLTTSEMKELGDDSIVPTEATLTAISRDARYSTMHRGRAGSDRKSSVSSSLSGSTSTTGARPYTGKTGSFLVSFVVDARGGTMRSARHPSLRAVFPPNSCRAPTRVTCRFSRRRRQMSLVPHVNNPSMFDAEGRACQVLEVGPQQSSNFLQPVAIEVPHFASLSSRQRQLAVLRSNDGETWKEHKAPCSDEVFRKQYAVEEMESEEELAERRVYRIVTSSLPRYFALVTRPVENAVVIGQQGGDIPSTVVPDARVFFPEGALTKNITVALQMLPVPVEVCKRAVGARAKASAILTIEPRRRKFHKPIKLTIPLPEGSDMRDYLSSTEDSTLRLLCSISGAADPAQWEDITGSTPLNFLDNCVTFTSTVSARFWLIDCRQIVESSTIAHQIYAEATRVPYMARFTVFARSHDPLEALVRVFLTTDDSRDERTLEGQEHFVEVARSRDVEVWEGSEVCLECSGNVAARSANCKMQVRPFADNRLQITIKVRDSTQDACGRLTFYRASGGSPKTHGPRKVLCSLNIDMPPCEQASSDCESEAQEIQSEDENGENIHPDKKKYFLVDPRSDAKPDAENVSDDVRAVLREVGIQWPRLARALGVGADQTRKIQMDYELDSAQRLAMAGKWLSTVEDGHDADEQLRRALVDIGRPELCSLLTRFTDDVIVHKHNIDEQDSNSIFNALSAELGSPYPSKQQHVSTPFPFSASTPQHHHDSSDLSAPAIKAENEPEMTTPEVRTSAADDDRDRPHFIYVSDDEADNDAFEAETDDQKSEGTSSRESLNREESITKISTSSASSGDEVIVADVVNGNGVGTAESASEDEDRSDDETEENRKSDSNGSAMTSSTVADVKLVMAEQENVG